MRCIRCLGYVSLCALAVLVGCIFSKQYYSTPKETPPLCDPLSGQCLLPQIRLVRTTLPPITTTEPIAKRDVSVNGYLQCSVKIQIGTISGSGTICHYNQKTHEAYIISCGHLFDGSKSPNEHGKANKAKIVVYYKNEIKLDSTQTFDAEIVCYTNEEDISVLKFKPDWVPQHCFPIAPQDYIVRQGDFLESVGCDKGEETAAYTVEIIDGATNGRNLVSKNNSPRPGRSGGGLLTQDGYYVGIVWGTSKLDGTGYGYNVPLRRIYTYLLQFEETKFLLSSTSNFGFDRLPIINKDNSVLKVPHGYFPSPRVF